MRTWFVGVFFQQVPSQQHTRKGIQFELCIYSFCCNFPLTVTAPNKMTIALLFVCPARPAVWGLMNDSKWKHENKISNAQSNPTLSTSPVYRISNGFCANLCYGYYELDLCQLAVTGQIIWEEHWQKLKAPSAFKLCCWDIHFKHSSPLTRLFFTHLPSVIWFLTCIRGIVSRGSEEGWIVPFLR